MNAQQNSFMKAVVPAAQIAQRKWDVPASVTIAQAILESSNQLGWGKSRLATAANNYFGIKAMDLANPASYVQLETKEFLHHEPVMVPAYFVHYLNLAESFDAHARLLAKAARYKPAMAVVHDPEAMCIALQKCGYSTNPSYAVLLAKLIQDYDLTQYDVPPEDPAKAQNHPTDVDLSSGEVAA